ncbi:MAG: hypothetical protein QHC77_12270 [Stenotrophomonas sp.]|uniref:hypothetical protein n=1 Tax=Stenotrophomonas sp. TaxID=69392 RepID=UPI0029BE1355|nr:hypothetical protein [Stenotrophomonas sp.]MDX3932699.1 hypothetical protein [Stenotrophomonas sp.]
MATAGSIVVDLLMRTGSFETDADRATKQVKKLGKDSSDSAAQVGAAFGKIGGVVAGGLTVATVAVVKWTRELVVASAEVEKLSRLSGTSEQTFQRLAAGASTVGIQQDKLGDIFKDTQDKLGDFLSTGGGAMKDFFEQIAPRVNLTADAFRNLSGPEVLQKYYKALEDAGVAQADMVFYMEAIASDSAMLAPLLANNGEGFRKWGAEAERVGAILDGPTIAAMKEVKEQSNQMDLAFQGLKVQIATQLLPEFRSLTDLLSSDSTQNAFISVIRFVAQLTGEMANGAVQIANFVRKIKDIRGINAGDPLDGFGTEALQERAGQLNEDIGRAVKARERILVEADRVNNENRIAALRKLRGDIAQELIRRDGPQVTLIDNGQMLPDSALKPLKNTAGSFRATAVDKESASKVDRLAEALKSANAQLERQVALYGDASELSRVTYDIQFGGLKGVDAAAQSALRSSASLLDMLGNIDEAEAIMAEDAQRFADAFRSLLGQGDDDTVSNYFDQMSAYAEQAARNMQDSFADFLFDPFAEGLGGMVDGVAKAMQRIAAEIVSSQAFEALGRWASSYSGAGSSWINSIGGAIAGKGGRAGGGPVSESGMYRVGEGGMPELFHQGGKTFLIPGDAGTVRPVTARLGSDAASAFGGASGMRATVNIENKSSAQFDLKAEDMRFDMGELFINMVARDLASGGNTSKALQQTFGLQRRGNVNG